MRPALDDPVGELDEEHTVTLWRLRSALSLGFTQGEAELLACSDADIHDVERQLERGCSHGLALAIFL